MSPFDFTQRYRAPISAVGSLLSVCLGLSIVGCGSSDPPPPAPGGGVKTVTATVEKPATPARGADTSVAAVPTEAASNPAIPAGDPITGAPDQFLLVTEEPQWEIVGKVPNSETLSVAALPEGVDSSSFELSNAAAARNPRGRPASTDFVDDNSVNIAPNRPVGIPVTSPAPSSSGSRSNGPLPEGFVPVAGAPVSADGYPLRIRCEKDDKEMVFVPGGVFQRGTDTGPSEAAPAQNVYLDPFYIDVTEVTVKEYETFRDAIREENKRYPPPMNVNGNPRHPVVGVSWGEAKYYARWSSKELPTEAQWEKAARGADGFRYPWGNGRPIWHRPRIPGQLDEIQSFRGDVSIYGVFDLAGNAREWCLDWWAPNAYQQAAAGGESTLRNPQGPKGASIPSHRAIRGAGDDWSAWNRASLEMGQRRGDLGFRCVLTITPEEPDEDKEESPRTSRPR